MIRLNDILEKAAQSPASGPSDAELISKAYVYSAKVHAGQKRFSGEPYLSHPLEVSLILAKLGLDAPTIATGLLHDTVEDTLATLEDIKKAFGDDISFLVDGATKVSELSYVSDAQRQAENFRKLILATARDVRVVLIKLADRLHNMRTLQFLPNERRRKISKETAAIYAPLARRLGIGWLTSELEDLAFKFLNPREHAKISEKLKSGHSRRSRKIREVTEKLRRRLAEDNIRCEVFGRVKSVFGIYGKMKWQNLEFSELHDIIAFRVVTESEGDCYLCLGKIHSLWKPVPGRIKDYISLPKSNGYRSIHTTVIPSDGDQMEVQIRTRSMHEFAENGIAAHWNYKRAGGAETEIQRQFSRMGEFDGGAAHSEIFMRSLKAELEASVIYVYTPKAELIELPVGSTPVDFAYRIHTKIGDRCSAASVNRKPFPLETALKTGDMVEIKTSPDSRPSEKWLHFAVTPKAKSGIKKSLARTQRERSLIIGRSICERRFASMGKNLGSMIASGRMRKPLEKLGFSDPDDFFRMVGFGRVSVTALQKIVDPRSEIGAEKMGRIEKILSKVAGSENEKITLVGGETIMTRLSNCCLPVPGERIIGHATRGSGVAVHSAGCEMRPDEINRESIVQVKWRNGITEKTPTGIFAACGDRSGLFDEAKNTIVSLGGEIVRQNSENFQEGRKYIFLIKVSDIAHLEGIMDSVSMLEGVVSVERCGGAPG